MAVLEGLDAPAAVVRRWSWRAAVSAGRQSDECQSMTFTALAHGLSSERSGARLKESKARILVLSFEGPIPVASVCSRVLMAALTAANCRSTPSRQRKVSMRSLPLPVGTATGLGVTVAAGATAEGGEHGKMGSGPERFLRRSALRVKAMNPTCAIIKPLVRSLSARSRSVQPDRISTEPVFGLLDRLNFSENDFCRLHGGMRSFPHRAPLRRRPFFRSPPAQAMVSLMAGQSARPSWHLQTRCPCSTQSAEEVFGPGILIKHAPGSAWARDRQRLDNATSPLQR